MKTFTPITLFAFGVIALIIGGTLGYTAGYDHGMKRMLRNTPPVQQTLPPFGQPPQNFVDCANSGNPVMESYPRQCRARNGQLFVEEIPDLTPPPTTATSSPVVTSPIPDPRPIPPVQNRPAPSKGACVPAGCSSQLCVDADNAGDMVTTCEFRAEYACYRTARCERQTNGACGWTQTPSLKTCLQNPPSL